MKQLLKKLFLSTESIILLALAFFWNLCAYTGARLIAHSWYHHDITSALDQQIPLVPWTVVIYFGCYLVWGFTYCLCAVQDKPARDRFFCADTISRAVCFVFYLVLPTTLSRPEITGEGLWNALMRLLYWVDAPDNLFPSIHCLISWFCWIGVRNRKDVPAAYRWFCFAAALAVCVSTVTTKQHVLADIAGGVLLAEVSYFAAGFPRVCRAYVAFVAWVRGLIEKRTQTA